MLLDNLSDLFQRGLEYAWDCEHVLLKHLPKMAEVATSEQLKALLEAHIPITSIHISRLERVFQRLDRSPAEEKSEPVRILLDECEKMMRHLDRSPLLDAAIAFSCNQMAHYQIGLYQSLCGLARTLNLDEPASLIDEILGEEQDTDREVIRLAEGSINRAASDVHNTPPFALI
jgi:ferritin-like metal-binding protein YciE